MVFTSVEIIALILIAVVAVKMLVLIVKPMSWIKFTKVIYKKPNVTKFIGAILAGVILYYLINSGMTIVQILAVSLFMAMMFIIGLAGDIGPFLKKYDTQIKAGKIWQKHWFYTLLWIALLVWGALVLFEVI